MRSIRIRIKSPCQENNNLKQTTVMRAIRILCNNIFSGTLTEYSKQEYSFRYDDEYFSNPSLPPVSITLPKSQQEYKSQFLFPFFTNMLPEGANRKIFCRTFKTEEEDYFGMLMATENLDIIGNVTIKTI